MIRYVIHDKVFNSKKELAEFVSNFLKESDLGAIKECEIGWVTEFLKMHPRYEQKAVDAVDVCIDRSQGNNHFSFVKSDGSHEDIGSKKCLNACLSSKDMLATAAFRSAVKKQIADFRRKLFSDQSSITCPESGKVLYNDRYTHVDHDFRTLTFQTLLAQFLDDRGIVLAEVETEPDGTFGRKLKDMQLMADFNDYHEKHAKVRGIHWTSNLRKKAA